MERGSSGSRVGGAWRRQRRWAGWRVYVLPVMLLLAVTLPKLDQGEFRTDTGWYSAIALQGWRTGSLWTLYGEPGQPYFNKPPMAFWIHGAFLHALGPSLWVARLPTLLACVGCVVTTVGLVRLFAGRTTALAIGCVLALTLEFFRRTHEFSLDMWQLAFMFAGLWLAAWGATCGRMVGFALGGMFVGCALLCKPLVALLVPVIVFAWLFVSSVRCGYTASPKRIEDGAIGGKEPDFGEDAKVVARQGAGCWARHSLWLGPVIMLLCAVMVAAPWHVSMATIHGRDFTAAYFGAEIAARAAGERTDPTTAPKPPWFYVSQLGRTYWPWLVCLGLGVWKWSQGRPLMRDMRGAWLAVIWAVTWLIAVSIFADRRDRYALPIYPGFAMLAGAWLARWPMPWLRKAQRVAARWIPVGAIVVCAGLSLAPVRVHAPPDPAWPALFAWLREHGEPELWQGAFAGDRGARLYLEFTRWPITTRNRWGEFVVDLEREPPAGALIVYHHRDGLAPGEGEEILWTMRGLTLTQLREPPWSPVEVPDPGEWRGP